MSRKLFATIARTCGLFLRELCARAGLNLDVVRVQASFHVTLSSGQLPEKAS